MIRLRQPTRWIRDRRRLAGARPAPAHPDLVITAEDERYLTSLFDPTAPLPASAVNLSAHPRLRELRQRYARLDLPPLTASRWNPAAVEAFLDHRYFRGETLITWHYRELPRATALKYFIYAQYVRSRDSLGLLGCLEEDGAFGCWTFRYPGHPSYSRDLLESVNEIAFLERQLALSARREFSVLDIGAGYGRLAHRMAGAYPNLGAYHCVDAVADATFLCEYYLDFRGCSPPARSLPIDELDRELAPGSVDLAVNVHSFSECTYEAIDWWLQIVSALAVPHLLIVPNEPGRLISLERDGGRRNFAGAIQAAGYRVSRVEPVIVDPAVRELVRLDDEFHLFEREG